MYGPDSHQRVGAIQLLGRFVMRTSRADPVNGRLPFVTTGGLMAAVTSTFAVTTLDIALWRRPQSSPGSGGGSSGPCNVQKINYRLTRRSKEPLMNRRITRCLLVAAASSGLVLTASPALAGEDSGEGFVPLPPEYYEQAPIDVQACGDTIQIEYGDVREVELRETVQPDGSIVAEYRGEATLDLTRVSDGAKIDELDIGGPGTEVFSPDGTQITNTLYGKSLAFAADETAQAALDEAGLPDLAYWKKGSATIQITINPETGEILSEEWIDIDARIIDLCQWFDGNRGHGNNGHHGGHK